MKLKLIAICLAVMVSVALSASAMNHAHRGPTSSRFHNRRPPHTSLRVGRHHGSTPRVSSSAPRRPSQIAPSRTNEIQQALIKTGYLTGIPTGQWDAETQAALRKFQGDNGWQTKIVPDSRAIIKLGLGPNAIQDEQALTLSSSPSSPQQ